MDLKNVETLHGDSPTEILIDMMKSVEAGDTTNILVLGRTPKGTLGIYYSLQDTSQLAELAMYLTAHVQDMLVAENPLPETIYEG